MTTIFFDTNIYNYAFDDGRVDPLRAWLDAKRFTAVASMVNLIELARTGDRSRAESLVRTLVRVTRDNEDPPFTKLLADEIRESISRHRPQWLRAAGWSSTTRRLGAYRKKWNDVRASPQAAFVRLPEFQAQHGRLEQGLFEQQRHVAAIERGRDVDSIEVVVPPALRSLIGDELADRVDRLGASERFVRLEALEHWMSAGVREWFEEHVTTPADREVAVFFLRDVEMVDVPFGAIRSVVRHLQPTRSVTPGNRNDLDQTSWLLRTDFVLTSDKRFFDLLLQARDQVRRWAPSSSFAQIGLVGRSGGTDILTGVKTAIAEAR